MGNLDKELHTGILHYIRNYSTDNQEGKEVCLQLLSELFNLNSDATTSHSSQFRAIYQTGFNTLNNDNSSSIPASGAGNGDFAASIIARYECK